MNGLQNISALTGRIFLSLLFILAGINKIGGYDATVQYMEINGVPGALLPLVIASEIGLGLAVALGIFSRLAALALAGFSILSALIFHSALGDQTQFILFMKNIAMAGGFAMVFAHGPGTFALDALPGIRRFSEALFDNQKDS